mgnify:CR=1 FL=1
MEKILIDWLKDYTETDVDCSTKFQDLNFDIFDESVVVDFVYQNFNININNKNEWYETVGDLIDYIAACT